VKSFATLRSAAALGLFVALPAAAQPQPPTVVWEQPARAGTVAFSPDGEVVASGGIASVNPFAFGRVDLWDADDGTQLAHRETHTFLIGATNEVMFSPDGATLASANGTVYCAPNGGCSPDRPGLFTWTVPALDPLAGRDDLSPAAAVAFAPDGAALAVAYFYDNDGVVRTHDPTTLATVRQLPGHQYTAADVAYAPDGTLLASVGDDGQLRLWDAATGAPVRVLEHGSYLEGGDPISVAFSPDGQYVATSGDGYNLRARVWRVAGGALVHDLDAGITPTSYGSAVVAFTPNGNYLVGGFQQYVPGDNWRGGVRFWSVATGDIVLEYTESGPPPYFGGVTSLAFSPGQDSLFAYTVAGRVKVVRTPISLAGGTPTPSEADPLPEGYRLSGAYPNPFNPSTTLTLEVAAAQRVRVEAFDAVGRRVATLFDGPVTPGAPRSLSFEAGGLPSGPYLLRVTGETFRATRRVTLLK